MFKTLIGVLNPKSTPTVQDIEKIPSFIFCRWLENDPRTIRAANQFNLYHSEIPIVNQYQVVKVAFAGKIKYIEYPKKTDVSIIKSQEIIAKHYKISLEKASDYMKFMSEDDINTLVNKYN